MPFSSAKFLSAVSTRLHSRYGVRRFSRLHLNVLAVVAMSIAFIAGSYFTLSRYLLPMIKALSETTTSMPIDVAFDRLAAEGLTGYDDGGGATYVLASEVTLDKTDDWWQVDFTKKKQLTLRNLSTAPLASESATTQQITVNTMELYDAGSLQANCEDLRVVFVATQSANMRTELPRSFYPVTGATNCSDSTATTVAFPLQEALWANGGSDSNYELYYGNASVGQANYRGEKALQFDGDDTLNFGALTSSFDASDLTIEAWVKLTELPGTSTEWAIAQRYSSGVGKGFLLKVRRDSGSNPYFQFNIWNGTVGGGLALYSPANVVAGKWYHLAGVYNSTTQTQTLYVDGVAVGSSTVNQYVGATSYGYTIGYSSYGNWGYAKAVIDSVRFSKIARYSGNFTPSLDEFATDVDTLVLTNFNEGSGTTITDSSGHVNATLPSAPATPTRTSNSSGYEITSANRSVDATLVCPFNGSTTCVGGETPTTATGAIRYSGGSALQFLPGQYVSTSLHKDAVRNNLTVEAFVKLDSLGYNPSGIISNGGNYTITLHYEQSGSGNLQVKVGGNWRSVGYSGLQAGVWNHIAGTYSDGILKVWVNGVLKGTSSYVAGDIDLGATGQTYQVARAFGFRGAIDEVRVSDIARYTENFTPQTIPFEPDEHTKLLLHFDENGDDPRNTGKAIDSSGNGNHGTITGAKYVSGLVGVDNSSSSTGALPASTYASHQGVFIEEGTTNKITNPSFEHSTYNTNWAQPVLFSLEDQFTTDRAAGAVNGSSAEPLGGLRTAINTSSKITISSGRLNFATGATVNDGVWYPAQARANGKVLVANITPSNTNGDVVFGWDNNQAGLINDAVKFAASGVLQVIPNGGTAITVGSYTATTYQVAGVLRSAGVYWFIKGGTYTQWTLLYATSVGTGDGYPAIQAGSITSVFTADNIRVPTTTWLPTPVAYDTFTRADGALGNTESTGPDGQVLTPLAWSGSTWGVVSNKAVNTPILGDEVQTNGSLEGTYSNGLSSALYKQFTPTVSESNDARSGDKAQEFLGNGSNHSLYQTSSHVSLNTGQWYLFSMWGKRTGASGAYGLGLSGGFQPGGLAYRSYGFGSDYSYGSRSSRVTNGSGIKLDWVYSTSTMGSSVLIDDLSIKPLSLPELFSTVSSGKSNVLMSANLTRDENNSSHPFGLVARLDNASNPQNFLIAYMMTRDNEAWHMITLEKVVNGTYTTLINTNAVSYSVGAPLSLVMNGASVSLYYNNRQVGTTQTVNDLGIINNTIHGTFSTTPTNSLDNVFMVTLGTNEEHIDIPSGMTVSENTTAPYFKFGSKAVRLENMADTAQQYATSLNPASTATHTLSAYVYDGTSGNVGGTVASSSAKLVFGGSEVTPASYTDMGGGWWRLSYSAATLSEDGLYGVQVLPGKTIYVDGVQLEAKAYATTYADGSLGSGYSWSGTEHESSGVRSASNLYYPVTSNLLTTEGTISFWAKPDWPSTMGGASRNYNTEFLGITGTTSQPAIYMNSGNSLFFAIKRNSASIIGATPAWTKGGWIHITGTWKDNGSGDVDEIKLYGNGVLLGTNSTADIPASWGSSLYVGSVSLGRYADSTMSDLRGFNKVLSAQEISNLYHSGLQTHTSSAEAVDRYPASGTYTSPIIDLGANGAWGSVPWSATNVLNGGGINYFTRTSMDNVNWSGWQAVTGSVGEGSWTGGIVSDPRRYFQWKADLTSNGDQSQSPVISSMSTTYVEDSTPPANPAQVALGFANHASSSATLASNSWYNYPTPKFTWEPGVDDPAAGQSSSGIDGYHVLLTTNQEATPSANLASPCYRFAESDDRIFSVGTTPASCTLSDADYYLRMQTKDNSGNVSDPVTLFTYRYDGTAPRSPVSVSSTTVGYTSQNEFSFYWPAASDQGLNQSGLAYYEYKTGATEGAYSTWTKSNEAGEELVTLASNITAYQEGQNFFFVRTVDFAGNVSAEISNLGVSPFYYNESAPTAPENLVITPVTTSDTPALENIFTVAWDKPASYSGELAKYYYCVNCTPSVSTMTETTSAQTTDRNLTNIALATQQGKNTFYLVAEDNNINPDTGTGNVNFEAFATKDFYASTIAPGSPTNLTISDASDRDAEVWRLTLAWKQATTGGTPNFYAIHRSSDGTTFTKIGETTSTAYTDADLTQGTTYSYLVYAIDNANSTSLASNTVTLAPEGKYTTPPMAGGSPNVVAGSTVVTITWSTGRIAYGAVEYGKTTKYEQSVAETTAVGNHSIRLTGLTPGTVYHYRVQALDDSILMGYDRENAYSSDYTFTTSALPTISNVEVTDLTLNSAIINWSAVSLAAASIEYGESTAYGSSVSVGVGSEGTYSTKLTSLLDSTTYHFRIRAVDIDGTDITSDDYTFTTLTFPKVTAVVFKTDQAQNATAINVAWSTNVPTTASVEYQAVKIDPSFASQSEINYSNSSVLQALSQTELARLPVVPLSAPQYLDRSTISNRHVVQITNLSDSSLYVFTIRGRDEYGNQAVSDPIRYVTGADTKPPAVENLVIETPIVGEGVESKAEIVLSFTTDEPAFSQVLWGAGTGSEYPQATQTSSEATTDHMIVLRDLKPTATYHLKIKTTDQSENISETEDTVVVTPTAQAAAFELILKNLEGIFGFLGLQ